MGGATEMLIDLSLQVHVLAGVFNSAHATALAWLHLLLLDIAQARSARLTHAGSVRLAILQQAVRALAHLGMACALACCAGRSFCLACK